MKRILALAMVLVFSFTILSGCTKDELAYFDLTQKSMANLKSMESHSDLTLDIDVKNLSDEQKEDIAPFLPLLRDMKFAVDIKQSRDASKGILKIEERFSGDVGDVAAKFNIWMDIDQKNNVYKEIIQIPRAAAAFIPKPAQGKPYIVMDFTKAPFNVGMSQKAQLDLFATDVLSNTFLPIIKKYMEQFNPGVELIKNIGTKSYKGQTVTVYQVKISDEALKKAIFAFVKDIVNNEESQKQLKEMIFAYLDVMKKSGQLTDDAQIAQIKNSVEQGIGQLGAMKGFVNTQMAKIEKAFSKVSILGTQGIVEDIYVNSQGQFVYDEIVCDFSVDMESVGKAIAEINGIANPSEKAPLIQVMMKCKTDITKYNQPVEVVLPTLTQENAIDFIKAMEGESVGEYELQPIRMLVNNKEIYAMPFRQNGRVMVPTRALLEELGAKVEWNASEDKITITKDNVNITLYPEKEEAKVNDRTLKLDAPVFRMNDITYIPVRFVSEALGAKVDWVEESNTVKIEQ